MKIEEKKNLSDTLDPSPGCSHKDDKKKVQDLKTHNSTTVTDKMDCLLSFALHLGICSGYTDASTTLVYPEEQGKRPGVAEKMVLRTSLLVSTLFLKIQNCMDVPR